MRKYDFLHKLDQCKNYSNDSSDGDLGLAEYIHDNFDKMDEIEMSKMLIKCLGINPGASER